MAKVFDIWEVRLSIIRNGEEVELIVQDQSDSVLDAIYNANSAADDWVRLRRLEGDNIS